MTWLIIALVFSNLVWPAILFWVLLEGESKNKALKDFYVNQLQLQVKHTEGIIRKWQVDINDRDIKLAERDKQWKEYTDTLAPGKKGEA